MGMQHSDKLPIRCMLHRYNLYAFLPNCTLLCQHIIFKAHKYNQPIKPGKSVNTDVHSGRTRFQCEVSQFISESLLSLFTHAALDIFEFGQDVEGKAISLASGPIATIHEVTKSQDQT